MIRLPDFVPNTIERMLIGVNKKDENGNFNRIFTLPYSISSFRLVRELLVNIEEPLKDFETELIAIDGDSTFYFKMEE